MTWREIIYRDVEENSSTLEFEPNYQAEDTGDRSIPATLGLATLRRMLASEQTVPEGVGGEGLGAPGM